MINSTFRLLNLLKNKKSVCGREVSHVDACIEDWYQAMSVNVRAQYYASKLIAANMIESGTKWNVINHISQAGGRRIVTFGQYGISQMFINGLKFRMSQELALYSIRENAISRDVTETSET